MYCYCNGKSWAPRDLYQISRREFHLAFSIRPEEDEVGFVPFMVFYDQMVQIHFDENQGPDVEWELGRLINGDFIQVDYNKQRNKSNRSAGKQQLSYAFFPPFIEPGSYQLRLSCRRAGRCRLDGTIEVRNIPSHRMRG